MLVIKNAAGEIVCTVGTPEDARQKAEQFAKNSGGSIEEMHFEQAEKELSEQAEKKREAEVAEVALAENALPQDSEEVPKKARKERRK